MIIRTRSPLLAAILCGKFNAEPLNPDGRPREVVETRPNGVTRTLHAEGRRRVVHYPHELCGDRHCYSHHIDEPGTSGVHTVCGECNHVFPTARALRRDARRDMLRVYWTDLTAARPRPAAAPPPDDPFTVDAPLLADRRDALRGIWRALTLTADDVTFCPHCIHDL